MRKFARAATIAIALAAFTVPWGAQLGADQGDEFTVTMQAFRFDPATISVTTGTTIIWRNEEVFEYPAARGTHRIVADGTFDTGDIAPGAASSLQVLEPFIASFRCTIHPLLMTGSIEVSGDAIVPEPLERTVKIVEPDQADPQGWGYDPEDVLVEAGTTITWRNEGTQPHTVTADDGAFDSGTMQPGDSFTFTFEKSAALRYHCDPHPWMTGLVRVATAGGKPPAPPEPPTKEPVAVPTVQQPVDRSGDGPVTFDVNIVEPDLANPQSWGFAPVELSARVGDTVVWTNTGSTPHTVTDDGGAFDSGDLAAGATYQITLEETGTIAYHCTPHPWMKATIVVTEAGAPAPEQPVTAPPVQPQDPGTPVDGGGEEPVTTDADPIATERRVFALGTGAAIMLLGAAFIVPMVLSARRRHPDPGAPISVDIREPAGVA